MRNRYYIVYRSMALLAVALVAFFPGAFFPGALYSTEPEGRGDGTDRPHGTGHRYVEYADAQVFDAWLLAREAAKDPRHKGYEVIRSLSAMLRSPLDGRNRFILPLPRRAVRRPSGAWDAAFPTPDEQAQLRSYLQRLVESANAAANSADRNGDAASAYRHRWYASGLESIATPVSANPPPAVAALTELRRSRDGLAQSPGGGRKQTHPITQWPASAYQLLQTQNFDIAIQGRQQESGAIGELCELTYAVWSQIFFEYWKSETTGDGFHGRAVSQAPLQVIIFRNRENYLRALEQDVTNVSVSTGYYSPVARASFFYMAGDKGRETLVHELTHQFFNERGVAPVRFDADSTRGFWGVEGIALVMESLSTREIGGSRLVDVGGWDAPRLQVARYRMLHDRMWFPWELFANADGMRFRDPEDIAPRYSQAAGLAHFWMEDKAERVLNMRAHLGGLYSQAENRLASTADPMEDYVSFLKTQPTREEGYLPFSNRNEIVLSRCPVEDQWVRSLLEAKLSLYSLDLSFTDVTDAFLPERPFQLSVERLNLESTRISDEILPRLASFRQLRELDLSNCNVSNEGLASLANHPTLKILWIGGTQVDDESIATIRSIANLESLHSAGSRITPEGWDELMKSAPKLKKRSTGPDR